MQTKHCPDCAQTKSKEAFGRSSPRCRDCARVRRAAQVKAASQRWLEKNPGAGAESCKKFYANNAESQRQRAKEWRANNPNAHKEATLRWRAENAERFAATKKKWRLENSEHVIASRRARYKVTRERETAIAREWKRRNKDKVTAALAARTAAKLRATPPWADMAKIAEIYAAAARLTAETGIPHDVDHIYPLRSKWCCGLHVENNLQILTATENRSKSNRRPTGASALRECVY